MSASKGPATTTSTNVGIGSVGSSRSTSSATARSAWNSTPSDGSLLRDNHGLVGPTSHNQSRPEYSGLSGYDDVFGGPPRYSNQGRAPPPPAPTSSSAASPFDSLFMESKESPTRASSMPVYDKLVYDDDIFDGVPGMKSTAAVRFDDIFTSMSNAQNDASQYDFFRVFIISFLFFSQEEISSSRRRRTSTREMQGTIGDSSGSSNRSSISVVYKAEDLVVVEQDYVGMSEVSSYPTKEGEEEKDGDELQLGLGLGLGLGTKHKQSSWGDYYRILTAKDFPSMVSTSSTTITQAVVAGTKRAVDSAPQEAGSNSPSQVVGWPPIRLYI